MTKQPAEIRWLDDPEQHDYPAAEAYLSLHFGVGRAQRLAEVLRYDTRTVTRKAKDIFRASGLSLLGVSNGHVAKNLEKVAHGKPLSPLLLVATPARLIIADGYHRMCAVYAHDEDADVPVRIAAATDDGKPRGD